MESHYIHSTHSLKISYMYIVYSKKSEFWSTRNSVKIVKIGHLVSETPSNHFPPYFSKLLHGKVDTFIPWKFEMKSMAFNSVIDWLSIRPDCTLKDLRNFHCVTAAQEHGINSQFTYLIGREGETCWIKTHLICMWHFRLKKPKTTFYTLPSHSIDFLQLQNFFFNVYCY